MSSNIRENKKENGGFGKYYPSDTNNRPESIELINKSREVGNALRTKDSKPYDVNSAISRIKGEKPYPFSSISTPANDLSANRQKGGNK